MRHGESEWNQSNRFTGWMDVPLSSKGVDEARRGGSLLRDSGLRFDRAFTSVLQRAIRTLWLALEASGQCHVPISNSWRLNERHYGALTGLNKQETVERHGAAQVQLWRRSYDVPPPPIDEAHPFYEAIARDERYAALTPSEMPAAESLELTAARVMPLWEAEIAPAIRSGKRVFVAAHGNSLRALVKHLDGISDAEICELNIPTGVPLVYHLDADLRPIPHPDAIGPLKGYYLGDRAEVLAAVQAVASQTAKK